MVTARILVAAISCMAACAGTRLSVRVEPPKGASKAGFYAAIGPVGERCIAGKRTVTTDAAGTILVTEEFCGDLQLVVAAPGYETQRRVLDTCDTKFVQVAMHAAKPVTDPSDACTTAAIRVMKIWLSHDTEALRAELVDPNDLQMYLRESHYDPWQLVFEPGVQRGDECSVKVNLFYDAGCEGAIRIDLLRVADSWRLRGLQDPY